ncbi:cobalt ECF transporter T component CbiQ [Parafrankia sp. BMG5.11]|uniref:cobalt ECF transporter T component CbiQ n=1 Tax=Parafrankia sp. BMG5.11 TaxID=222540 RepID=UPI00103B8123|nr:cobalt ECF transporter T component CbiQ [Parafrankia sp. BMG5.11]TCJ40130.1 cobalt ECF transporter T component CbiQ [Parafrankia sp. BMG5.11]
MGGAHVLDPYHPGGSVLHRLPAQCKIAATFGYVVCVVLTPITAGWAFGAHLAVVSGLCALARLPPGLVLRRLAVELPFVAFAVALPFVVPGERTEVLGVALSRPGLEQAFGLVARATLGLMTVIVLAATTPARELLVGLERLRMPPVIVAVASFMIRYAGIVIDQMGRMSIARRSRAHEPRSLLATRALAASLGTLFIRSYERGERVHLAMLARGYTGALPGALPGPAPRRAQWGAALCLVILGAAIAVLGRRLDLGAPA